MKIIKRIYLPIIALVLSACSSFTDELTLDPNRPTDADPMNMIQGPMVANQFFHTGEAARLAGIYTNHFTGQDRQYVGLNDWNTQTSTDNDSPWGTAYYGVVTQCRIIAEKAIAEVNPALAGVAQILEAHTMGTVTSLWGDVPYSEAIDDAIANPAFDAQADVYASLQDLLDGAIVNLNAGGSISTSKDFVYGGDLSAWEELAYSLKARYYLHVGDYANANTNAALGISSPANDMLADFGSSYGNTFNPYYSFMVYDRSGYMGAEDAYAPNLLDPFDYFPDPYSVNRNNAKTNEAARSFYNYSFFEIYTEGYEPNYLNDFDWGTNNGKFGQDMYLVTYGEMLLIQAEYEALTNGLSAGVTAYNTYRQLLDSEYGFIAQTYYGAGSTSFNYDDYADADFAPGGMEDPLSTAATPVDALLREIYEERYVYFTGNIESFTDLRRTDNMAEIQLKDYAGTPERFLYPQSEINANTSTPSPVPSITTPTQVHQ